MNIVMGILSIFLVALIIIVLLTASFVFLFILLSLIYTMNEIWKSIKKQTYFPMVPINVLKKQFWYIFQDRKKPWQINNRQTKRHGKHFIGVVRR